MKAGKEHRGDLEEMVLTQMLVLQATGLFFRQSAVDL